MEHTISPPERKDSDAALAYSARDNLVRLFNASRDGDLVAFKEAAQALDHGQGLSEAVADVRDANGRGILHFAARSGQSALCKYLLEDLKLPVDVTDNEGETPLIHAARQGFSTTAQYLIEQGANALVTAPELGTSPLHHAAGTGENASFFRSRAVIEQHTEKQAEQQIGPTAVQSSEQIKDLSDEIIAEFSTE